MLRDTPESRLARSQEDVAARATSAAGGDLADLLMEAYGDPETARSAVNALDQGELDMLNTLLRKARGIR
jgi:hypothetical protein